MQKSGTLAADQNARLANNVLRASSRMKFLIEDLPDTAQTAQGNQISIQKKPADLRGICQSVIEEFRFAHPNRTIEFFAADACRDE